MNQDISSVVVNDRLLGLGGRILVTRFVEELSP
jgi:hypothetical protein